MDKFDNVWIQGPSRTRGQTFEWDVQLSKRGQEQIGWLTIAINKNKPTNEIYVII